MEFQPVVYEHAASFIQRSPWEVSRDPELFFQAHLKAADTYRHNPVVVGIDIYNLEVEAYGATIEETEDNTVPSPAAHVCSSVKEILQFPPLDPLKDGRIPLLIDIGKRLASEMPDRTVSIPVSGPFSIAANLVGLDGLLCEVIQSPDSARDALLHIVEGQVAFCDAVRSAGLDISLFESAASPPILSPALFEQCVYPALSDLISRGSSAAGQPLGCVIGGNTEPIIDMIVEAGANYVICPRGTNQQGFMNRMQYHPGVKVRVNMNPGVFNAGPRETVEQEAKRAFDIARQRSNTSVGTGVLAFEADPKLVLEAKSYLASMNTAF